MELSTQSGGVTQNSGGSAVRWEQGTCNASFRDEAQKLRNIKPESNGKKVESRTFAATASQFHFTLSYLVLKDFDISRFKVEALLSCFVDIFAADFALLFLKTAYSALTLTPLGQLFRIPLL